MGLIEGPAWLAWLCVVVVVVVVAVVVVTFWNEPRMEVGAVMRPPREPRPRLGGVLLDARLDYVRLLA